ncbi:MAG: hypothetical protein KC621_23365, partial [Myxococcales bacterium]|nr:hypothetical protein [Myxococcales bacterium]
MSYAYTPMQTAAVSPSSPSPFDSAHPQYQGAASNSEQLDAMTSVDLSTGGLTTVTCPGGAAQCDPDEALTSTFDPMSGKMGQSISSGGVTFGGSVTPDFAATDEHVRVGGGSAATGSGEVGGEKLKAGMELGAALDMRGNIRPLPDGRFLVSSDLSQEAVLGGSASFLAGAKGKAAGQVRGGGERIVSAADVAWARAVFAGNDALAAQLLLRSSEATSVLDLEPGESNRQDIGVNVSAGASLELGVGGSVELGGGGGYGATFRRTEEGVVVEARRRVEASGALGLSVGCSDVGVKAGVKQGKGRKVELTARVTLDPVSQADTIRALEAVDSVLLYGRLQGMSGVVLEERVTDEDTHSRDVSLLATGYQHDEKGALIPAGAPTGATYSNSGAGRALGQKYAETRTDNAVDGEDGSVLLTSTQSIVQPGLDTGATLDPASPIDTVTDLATVGQKRETVRRRLRTSDLDRLPRMAGSITWEMQYPKGHGEAGPWLLLGIALEAAGSLQEDERRAQVELLLCRYIADGGDMAALDRFFDEHDLGRSEQWPASIEHGAARMTAAVAKVA